MHLTPEQWDWLIRAGAIAIGLLLKQMSWYPTKFIPVATLVVSVIVRLASGLGIEVPAVGADVVISTGIYSTLKNVIQGLVLAFGKKK